MVNNFCKKKYIVKCVAIDLGDENVYKYIYKYIYIFLHVYNTSLWNWLKHFGSKL